MRRINNPWLNIPGYNCFGCNPGNPLGVHMHFYEDGDDIVSVWCPTQNHQSWINTLHGGVQAVLLDEICGWVIFKKCDTSGVTAKMTLNYKATVDTTQGYIVLRARIKERKRNVVVVEGEIYAADGKLCAQAECTYFTFSQEKAQEMQFVSAELVGDDLTIEEVIALALAHQEKEL